MTKKEINNLAVKKKVNQYKVLSIYCEKKNMKT